LDDTTRMKVSRSEAKGANFIFVRIVMVIPRAGEAAQKQWERES